MFGSGHDASKFVDKGKLERFVKEQVGKQQNANVRNLDNRPVLDLSLSHFERQLGDLKLYGTWYGVEVAKSEPCLALIPAYRSRGFKPCVVCLSVAWRWNEPGYAAQRSVEFCDALGIDPGPKNCARIASIIHSHLGDLVKIPPRPHRHVIVGGTGRVTTGDGKVIQSEIIHKV